MTFHHLGNLSAMMSNELPCEPFGISHTHSFHLPPHNANLSVPISSRLSCAYISTCIRSLHRNWCRASCKQQSLKRMIINCLLWCYFSGGVWSIVVAPQWEPAICAGVEWECVCLFLNWHAACEILALAFNGCRQLAGVAPAVNSFTHETLCFYLTIQCLPD